MRRWLLFVTLILLVLIDQLFPHGILLELLTVLDVLADAEDRQEVLDSIDAIALKVVDDFFLHLFFTHFIKIDVVRNDGKVRLSVGIFVDFCCHHIQLTPNPLHGRQEYDQENRDEKGNPV